MPDENSHTALDDSDIVDDTKDARPQEEAATEGFDEGDFLVELKPPGIIIEKNDRSLSEFQRWYKTGRLIVDPEWQRQYVWDIRRASKLIE